MMEETENSKSAFNMGAKTLERIDKILKEVEFYAFSNQYQLWARKLINLYKEIRPFHKDPRKREGTDKQLLFAKLVDMKIDFGKQGTNYKMCEIKLNDIEMHLRDLLNDYDLLMPRKDDPRFAILQR